MLLNFLAKRSLMFLSGLFFKKKTVNISNFVFFLQNIEKLRNTVTRLADALGTQQVVGRKQTIIDASDIKIGVQKVSSPTDLANVSISTSPDDPDGSKVEMPSNFLNASGYGEMTVLVS